MSEKDRSHRFIKASVSRNPESQQHVGGNFRVAITIELPRMPHPIREIVSRVGSTPKEAYWKAKQGIPGAVDNIRKRGKSKGDK